MRKMIFPKNTLRIKEGILLMGWMLLLVIFPTPCVLGKQRTKGDSNITIKGDSNKIIVGKETDKKKRCLYGKFSIKKALAPPSIPFFVGRKKAIQTVTKGVPSVIDPFFLSNFLSASFPRMILFAFPLIIIL